MAIPSRILGSGNAGLSTTSIAGDGAVGLVAAGTNAATALQLSAVHNTVATTAASTGVKLQPTEAGAMVTVYNAGANALLVYPFNVSSTVNGTTSFSIASGKAAMFVAPNSTTWFPVLSA